MKPESKCVNTLDLKVKPTAKFIKLEPTFKNLRKQSSNIVQKVVTI